VEHERRVAAFPTAIRKAHTHSAGHRAAILASSICGCFFCCATFEPAQIEDWIDMGQTALCPRCGVDSVIGDRSGATISVEFLEEMNRYGF
jgi:hypothetical protein